MPIKKDIGLVIPKTTSNVEDFIKPLKALEDTVCTWVSGEEYFERASEQEEKEKNRMTLHHRTSYPVYFGLMDSETIGKGISGKRYRLNPIGLAFLTAYTKGRIETCTDIIMGQLEDMHFGNNQGVSTGKSSIQPPILALKLAQNTGYVTDEMLVFAIEVLEKNELFKLNDILGLIETVYPNWTSPDEIKRAKVEPAKILLNLLKGLGILEEADKGMFVLSEYVEENWFKYIEDLYIRKYTEEEMMKGMEECFDPYAWDCDFCECC